MFVRIDHVQLAMPAGQEAQAQHFYASVLGFKELEKPAPLQARGGCWFQQGNITLHLGIEADFRAAKKAHPAFEVSDLSRLAEQLSAHHLELSWDELLLPQTQRFYTHDPFGNRLEFLQHFPTPQ